MSDDQLTADLLTSFARYPVSAHRAEELALEFRRLNDSIAQAARLLTFDDQPQDYGALIAGARSSDFSHD